MGEEGEDEMYGEEGESEGEDPSQDNVPESASKRPKLDWKMKMWLALYYSKWNS